MKYRFYCILLVLLLSFVLPEVNAQTKGLINFQAVIQVEPAVQQVSVRFEMYPDSLSRDNLLWSESRRVQLQDGAFNVLLGSVNELHEDLFVENLEIYLQLVVDGQDLLPRYRITSVPHAIVANRALVADEVAVGGSVRIESGTFNINDNEEFRSGIGVRQVRGRVVFDVPFDEVPVITTALKGMDVSGEKNTRIGVAVENIDVMGFDYVISTWADTIIFGADYDWLAYGR